MILRTTAIFEQKKKGYTIRFMFQKHYSQATGRMTRKGQTGWTETIQAAVLRVQAWARAVVVGESKGDGFREAKGLTRP